MPFTQHDERRVSIRLLQYWNRLRGDRPYPSENDIDPDALVGLWDYCFLVQLRDIHMVADYNYTYFGNELIHGYEHGVLDSANGMMACPDANALHQKFVSVIETRAPMMEQDEYENAAGNKVQFRQSLMPLGDETGIYSIIGAVNWRIIKAKASDAA
ncbi:MAG: hypothetical protein CMM93_00665 [Rickettsiales bacterium]|nr:hypothetical protein [Rickettsiales bacterium]|tara:strand:- start:1408 stop:1878 length:471 start_codon:yes stop_codon:yes gene_type:complete